MNNDRMKPLIIVGAGGLGREVAWLVADINKQSAEWDLLGFVDDGVTGYTVEGYQVLGGIDSLFLMQSPPWVVVAIANSRIRKGIVNKIHQQKLSLATLIAPSVRMSKYVQIEPGSIICAGSVLTTNIKLGLATIINPNCFIGHDTVLKDFVSLMPGVNVAGEVMLEEGVYMGLSSCVINRCVIGKWTTIGAGSTVVKDLPAYSLAVGVPARVIKFFK